MLLTPIAAAMLCELQASFVPDMGLGFSRPAEVASVAKQRNPGWSDARAIFRVAVEDFGWGYGDDVE